MHVEGREKREGILCTESRNEGQVHKNRATPTASNESAFNNSLT